MPNERDINKRLVAELIKGPASDLWSRKNLRREAPLFSMTFNTNELRTPAYSTVTHSPQELPKDLQQTFTEVVSGLLTTIQRKTGVKIGITTKPDTKHNNVLFVCVDNFAGDREHAAAVTRSVYTEDGSVNGPAFSKIIQFNAEYLRNLPRITSHSQILQEKIFNSTAAHEFGHAVGLTHPIPNSGISDSIQTFWRLGFVPTRNDTIMAGTMNVQKCFNDHPGSDKEIFCAHLFPDTPFSKEDMVAIEEQVKRSINKSYASPYLSLEDVRDLYKDLLSSFKSGLAICVAAFAQRMIQHYIVPILIQEFRLSFKNASLVGYSMRLAIDVALFSLPNAILSNASALLITVINNALQQWKINFDLKKLHFLFVAIEAVIKTFPTNFTTALAGAFAGHSAAVTLIHALPKLRIEDKPAPAVQHLKA